MNGYIGKILRVDLSVGKLRTEKLSEATARAFIGARGYSAKILYDELGPKVDAFAPENRLIFATGPLTGTKAPTGGRYIVACKSPLTGAIAASNSGGFWGNELKRAGYDIVIFEGKAPKPVYLWIKNGTTELKDAGHLWGKSTFDTTDILLEELGEPKARVACIGQAGEKLSRIACVINDKHRAAGRSGVGAVMGSKNLKALAVRGTGNVPLADPDGFDAVVKASIEKLKTHPVTSQALPAYGTAVLVNIVNESGVLPTRNFQEGQFEGADKISGETLASTLLTKKTFCYMCPIGCGRETKVGDILGEGPEYESVWAYGAQCGVDDLEAVTLANYACNEYGLDTISAGSTIGCAMELSQRGYISEKIKWGDGKAIVELTKKMGLREGIGDEMAEGSYRFAEKYGHPELSMSVKKQELPAYDTRGIKGHGITYAVSNRGGCHVRGYMISPEILGVPEKLDPLVYEGKAQWAMIFHDLTAVIDSSGMCLFTSFAMGAEDYTALLKAATGFEYDTDAVMKCGERIWTLERLFNQKAGFTKADDTLPKRLLEEPMPKGPAKGHVWERAKLLPEYYKLRGWDADGKPTAEKLKELGL